MKWEYQQITLHLELGVEVEATLEKLGDEGWELAAVVPKPDQFDLAFYYFKRPIPNTDTT